MNNKLKERNEVWDMMNKIIKKRLKIKYSFLNPNIKGEEIFGNFVKGDIESFKDNYNKTINEIQDKIPNNYLIVENKIITKDLTKNELTAVIGLQKR